MNQIADEHRKTQILILNEQTKYLASAIERAATALLAAFFFGPLGAILFGSKMTAYQVAGYATVLVVSLPSVFIMHSIGRGILKELKA